MRGLRILVAAGLAAVATAQGAQPQPQPQQLAANCVLHQALPKPTGLAKSALVQEAAAKLTAAFEASLKQDTVVTVNNSWSLQAWSLHEDEPFWTHYHAAKNLEDLNQNGTTKIDENTVYRLGSLTKIFTVLTWLAVDGDKNWLTPVTEFLPELRDIQARTKAKKDPVRYVDWDEITIGALAGQMAGIPRDCE
jgi:CubicO group peptidase (beta-lactamase class C family)